MLKEDSDFLFEEHAAARDPREDVLTPFMDKFEKALAELLILSACLIKPKKGSYAVVDTYSADQVLYFNFPYQLMWSRRIARFDIDTM